MILSSILTFLGCKNKEKKFLEEHEVLLCSSLKIFPKNKLTDEVIKFEKSHNITFNQASNIYLKFSGRKLKKSNLNESDIILPSLIIDKYYVYSFKNIKMLKIATFGIWIDADTGEIINNNNDKIWLLEDDILKAYKKK